MKALEARALRAESLLSATSEDLQRAKRAKADLEAAVEEERAASQNLEKHSQSTAEAQTAALKRNKTMMKMTLSAQETKVRRRYSAAAGRDPAWMPRSLALFELLPHYETSP